SRAGLGVRLGLLCLAARGYSQPAAESGYGTRRPHLFLCHGGTVYVACSTLCFARYPLERVLRLIAELEFSRVDIAIHEQGPHLRPSEVAADVNLAAQRIRIGPSLTPAAFSVEIEASSPEEFQRQLRAVCHLARMSTVSVITLPAAS